MGSGSFQDRISGLPDDLLHGILVRLHSAHAATRTSVLSRRWRRVWANLPELVFVGPYPMPWANQPLLRLRAAGVFAALTDLKIRSASMEVRDLEALVSSQCPRLRDLTLRRIMLVGCFVSIRSGSLRRLKFGVQNVLRLEVAAPMLEVFVACPVVGAYISAPKLAEAKVHDLHRYQFADAGPHLRRLDIAQCYVSTTAPRTRRLETVDELRLRAFIGTEGYNSFLDGASNLPKCRTLSVSLLGNHHVVASMLLHLLRRDDGIRKLVVETYPSMNKPCLLACPCRSTESYRTDNITLDSLEVIEFNSFTGAGDQVELLKLLLSRCSATKLRSVEINKSDLDPLLSEEVGEKIRNICSPNLRVKLHVISNGRPSELIL